MKEMENNTDQIREALIGLAQSAMDAAPDEATRTKMRNTLVDNAVEAIERASLGIVAEVSAIDRKAGIEIDVLVNGAVRVAQLAIMVGLAMHDLDKTSDEDLQRFVDKVQEHLRTTTLLEDGVDLRKEAAKAREVFEAKK